MKNACKCLISLLKVLLGFINYRIIVISFILRIPCCFGYEPGSISGKYQFLEIGSGFYYDYWMPTMKNNWGSESIVREAFAPSAMVDWDGNLYTAHVSDFNSSGIKISLKRNENGKTVLTNDFYPWTYIPSTTVAGRVTTSPNLGGTGKYFNYYIHNIFMPTIVQEAELSTSYIRMFLYIPPTRYMNAYCSNSKSDGSGIEGVMSMRLRKSNLSLANSSFYYHKDNSGLWFNRQSSRRVGEHRYPVINSNYAACLWYGSGTSDIWLYYVSGKEEVQDNRELHYIRTVTTLSEKEHNKFAGSVDKCPSDEYRLINRFIKHDNYIYFIGSVAGYWIDLYMQGLNGQYRKGYLCPGIYTETYTSGAEPSSYDYDFCILKNPETNTLVLGVLNFGANNNTYWSYLTEDYNWSSTFCNWPTKNLSLVLSSWPLTSGNSEQNLPPVGTWAQNVIYMTDVVRGYGSACNLANTTKEDLYRFYLNTHKICTDITNPDSKYIFYCYCYPGKTKQLYLGYAQYSFDSNNRITLGPKFEFRASASQWSSSFGNFTSCSRIISMDCKNGHLWITWMNADNTKYYAFHILVKDLVGE